MATAKSTTSKAKPAASKAAAADKSVQELEAKIAGLEASISALKAELEGHCAKSKAEHAALAAKCDACCDASGGGLSAEQERRLSKVWAFCRKLGLR